MRFIIFLTILCISAAFTADKSAVTQKAEASHPIPIPPELLGMKPAAAPPVPPIPPELLEMKPSELNSRKQMAEAATSSPATLDQNEALNLGSKSPMPSREKKHKLSSKTQKAEERTQTSLPAQNEREQYVNEKK